ncbi:uncharacterized protein LOC115003995 isoform X2 [Cottoperca gobio]|uniref:Uncharacterized protein LOC115003995 isoform X2 n=1 Tax=Cottoperca gobio TaxID=56716 RepID=A0A6J2P9B0_COTGO|nr:uncharacterized protein LOC115003995 isoform X2 [Cottoperca gobio]
MCEICFVSPFSTGEVMSSLLKEIDHIDTAAARVFEGAGLHTDSDIRSVTREELHELFPESKNIKRRRTIFDLIHKQKPVEQLLREVREFIPDDNFKAALTDNGVLVNYLSILKDMKTQMNNIQSFLDAHINVLEEFRWNQPNQESALCISMKPHDDGQNSYTSTSSTSGQMEVYNPHQAQDSIIGQPGRHQQGAQTPLKEPKSCPPSHLTTQSSFCGRRSDIDVEFVHFESFTHLSPHDATVMYRMVVSGQTFGAHQQLMDKFKNQDQFILTEDTNNYEITFVFCPISSRIQSDVDAAMSNVKDDKPVILVLMHHTREAKIMTYMKTYDAKVQLHVNVFYHETKRGLIPCYENRAAVTDIQRVLWGFIKKS